MIFRPHPLPAAANPADTALMLRIFAVLWALAIYFHLVSFSYPLTLASVVTVLLAWVVVVRPRLLPFMLLLGVHTVHEIARLPSGHNHMWFSLFINVCLMTALLTVLIQQRRWAVSLDTVYRRFAPSARVCLLILYFFVTFHKLNADFLDPARSCAVQMYRTMAEVYSILPLSDDFYTAAIYFTLLVELAIPLLLYFASTRLFGVLVAMLFHMLLALHPGFEFFNFAAMLYAMFFLFLPDSFSAACLKTLQPAADLWGRWQGSPVTRRLSRGWLYVGVPLLLTLLTFREDLHLPTTTDHARAVWLAVGIASIAVVLITALRVRTAVLPERSPQFRIRPVGLALVPLLLVLNGAAPYLGLKTQLAFSMFSNLHTEDGYTNHLIVPVSTQLWDYQRNLVYPIEAEPRGLQRRLFARVAFTTVQFREHVNRFPDGSVTYDYNGERHEVTHIGGDPLLPPLTFFEHKLLIFRPIPPPDNRGMCRH